MNWIDRRYAKYDEAREKRALLYCQIFKYFVIAIFFMMLLVAQFGHAQAGSLEDWLISVSH